VAVGNQSLLGAGAATFAIAGAAAVALFVAACRATPDE
jgi:hypothetical protein